MFRVFLLCTDFQSTSLTYAFLFTFSNTQSALRCLVSSLAMMTLYLHSYSHMASQSTWWLKLSTWGGTAFLDRERGCWKILHFLIGFCIMRHKQENPVLAKRNFCDYITPNIWPPNSTDCNVLYYVWSSVEWETKKLPVIPLLNWRQG